MLYAQNENAEYSWKEDIILRINLVRDDIAKINTH